MRKGVSQNQLNISLKDGTTASDKMNASSRARGSLGVGTQLETIHSVPSARSETPEEVKNQLILALAIANFIVGNSVS